MKINTNNKKMQKQINSLQSKLNKTRRPIVNSASQLLKDRQQSALNRAIDKPTPFTQRAVYATKARYQGDVAIASVFIKDIQSAYLDKQMSRSASDRRNKNSIVPMPKRKNKYGNLIGKRKLKSNRGIHAIPYDNKPYKALLVQYKGLTAKQVERNKRIRGSSGKGVKRSRPKSILIGIIKDEQYTQLYDWDKVGRETFRPHYINPIIHRELMNIFK